MIYALLTAFFIGWLAMAMALLMADRLFPLDRERPAR
jgi:hypothetical protein